MMKINQLSVAAALSLALVLSSPASAALVMQFDSGVGVTSSSSLVTQWNDQAVTDGAQNLAGTFSRRPTLVSGGTPTGQAALAFDGSSPNQLTSDPAGGNADGPVSALGGGPSLTFMVVLKPGAFNGTTDTYLQAKISNAPGMYGWGLLYEDGKFQAMARNTTTGFYSTVATSALASGMANDWMILTGVYDGTAGTIQLFVTDADKTLVSGSAVTVTGGLANGTVDKVVIGADHNRSHGAPADIAALYIWNEALNSTNRATQEAGLYETYLNVPEPAALGLVLLGGLGLRRRQRRIG